MKLTILGRFLIISSLFFSSLSFALDLDEAKDKGLVGEKDNGYLGLVLQQGEMQQADAQKLITEVNAKRREIYLQLAEKNGITLEQVEKLAAQKAYTKTLAGHYLWVNGSWQKK